MSFSIVKLHSKDVLIFLSGSLNLKFYGTNQESSIVVHMHSCHTRARIGRMPSYSSKCSEAVNCKLSYCMLLPSYMYVGCHEIRYSVHAKRIFNELHEQAFIVELDLRGTSNPIVFTLSMQLIMSEGYFSFTLCVVYVCVCVGF